MRSGIRAVAFLMVLAAIPAGASEEPKDVPADHWARKDVQAVLEHGVMSAPGGKFGGAEHVSRSQLIRTMAAFARSVEKGSWQPGTGGRFRSNPDGQPPASLSKPVNRYQLAAVLSRMGRYAAAGMPKAGPKRFGDSPAIPDPPSAAGVNKNDPSYADLQYLLKNRMVWTKSVLAKPGPQTVTGKEVAAATVAVITALIDQRTDEPQNREDIGPPPNRDGGAPARANPPTRANVPRPIQHR